MQRYSIFTRTAKQSSVFMTYHNNRMSNQIGGSRSLASKLKRDEKSTVMEFSLTPVGKGTPSMTEDIKCCENIVKTSGLNHEVNAMGTVVQGTLHECMDLIEKCAEKSLENTERIILSTRIDIRPGHTGDLIKGKKDKVC